MVKVVKFGLICEQVDKDKNPVDYKDIYKILWDLQRQTRELKNKAVQLCWEYSGFESEYKILHGYKPKDKDILGYTLKGYVDMKLRSNSDLYSANLSTTVGLVCDAFKNKKSDILKGQVSVISYKTNQPLELHNKSIRLKYENGEFYTDISLLNNAAVKKYNFKTSKITFKALVKDKSTRTILERCIDGIYSVSASKLIYDRRKKQWFLNLAYNFQPDVAKELDKDKILGVDLGCKKPIVAPVCGDGRIGHGVQTRNKPAYNIEDKIARFRDTVNHKYSRSLIEYALKNNCGTIQMEDLTGIADYSNKFLKNWSYYDLQTKIEYKAAEAGIAVIKVKPRYTSQRCSKCGYIDKENRQTQEHFECLKCGFKENADYNASQNLAIPKIDEIIDESLSANN